MDTIVSLKKTYIRSIIPLRKVSVPDNPNAGTGAPVYENVYFTVDLSGNHTHYRISTYSI